MVGKRSAVSRVVSICFYDTKCIYENIEMVTIVMVHFELEQCARSCWTPDRALGCRVCLVSVDFRVSEELELK